MTMNLAAALVYWVVVAVWLAVLATVAFQYIRNPQIFGTTKMLLSVIAIDTGRNLIENIYFGLFFGGQYGLFPAGIVGVLGNPSLLIVPKLINIAAGCAVFGLLIITWLPKAVRERRQADQLAVDLGVLAAVDGLT